MNKVIMMGRLVANPSYKINEKGTKICYFRLAVSSSDKYPTTFIDVISFNRLAEQCQSWTQKGTKVLVEGKLDYKKIGDEKRDYYSIIAQTVQFLKGMKQLGENKNDE
ncbi:MAG: single-stranded DNA-binding protein [Candidatus Helarchaeota archaeon]